MVAWCCAMIAAVVAAGVLHYERHYAPRPREDTEFHDLAVSFFAHEMRRSNASGFRSWMAGADMYEFGVYTGVSLGKKIKEFLEQGLLFRKLFGFDSFEGLPEGDLVFRAGVFNARSYLRAQDLAETLVKVRHNIGYRDVELVAGMYNESLTDELPRSLGMGKAFWINVDCDLYTSSQQALDWVFRNDLVEPGKTYIYFDDAWYYRIYGQKGQVEAFQEIREKYSVMATPLLTTPAHQGGVPYLYRIDAVASLRP